MTRMKLLVGGTVALFVVAVAFLGGALAGSPSSRSAADPRAGLAPERAHGRGGRTHEGQSGVRARLREAGVLREKAIPGMHGVGVRGARDLDEAIDDEIAFDGGGGTDGVRLVRHLHVQRLAIGLGEHGDGGEALLAAGADDADGDLATVGDEELLELHARSPVTPR